MHSRLAARTPDAHNLYYRQHLVGRRVNMPGRSDHSRGESPGKFPILPNIAFERLRLPPPETLNEANVSSARLVQGGGASGPKGVKTEDLIRHTVHHGGIPEQLPNLISGHCFPSLPTEQRQRCLLLEALGHAQSDVPDGSDTTQVEAIWPSYMMHELGPFIVLVGFGRTQEHG